MPEVKSQYDAFLKRLKEKFPEVGVFLLHTAIINWLNKEINPDYEEELLNTDMSRLNE